MSALKRIEIIIVLLVAVICGKVVNSFTPSNTAPTVQYDVGLFRLVEEILIGAVQSVDLVLLGTSDYPPVQKDVTFWCIKPNSDKFVQVLLNDPNLAANFNVSKPLAFIVHGYVSSFRGGVLNNFTEADGWMELMARDYSYYSQTNVCCVDWSRLAIYDYLSTLFVNIPIVVSYMTQFITKLLQLKITTASNLTIIGHSFGAHIAGRVGGNLNGSIKSIYGLDAAGPLITFPFMTDPSFRLDPTDAQYVQVLHTDGLLLGSAANLGHTDIYANGGTLQPGCLLPILMPAPFATIPVICDHMASIAYFTTSCNPYFKFNTISSNSTGLLIDVAQPVVQLVDTVLGEGPNFQAPAAANNPANVHDLLGPFNLGHHGQFSLTTQQNFPYTTTQ